MVRKQGYGPQSQEEFPVVVVEQKLRAYAFTLKRTSKRSQITEPLYINHIGRLMSKGATFQERTFETESGLHMHGILELPSNFDFRQLRVRGWHLHLVEIFNKKAWLKYIHKHDDAMKELNPDRRLHLSTGGTKEGDEELCEERLTDGA